MSSAKLLLMLNLISMLGVFAAVIQCIWTNRDARRITYNQRALEQMVHNSLLSIRAEVNYAMRQLEQHRNRIHRSVRTSEKLAERAFSLASSANVGLVSVSRTLNTKPRLPSRHTSTQDALINKKVDKMFGDTFDQYEWLRPVLSNEENDVLDQIIQNNGKA